jgi:hypothetical protein
VTLRAPLFQVVQLRTFAPEIAHAQKERCDGLHKNAVLLLRPLELLKAAQDRLQGYYFSHLFDLLTDPNKACGELWSVLRYRVELFSSIGRLLEPIGTRMNIQTKKPVSAAQKRDELAAL